MTDVDRTAERIIAEVLLAAEPGSRIVGEELQPGGGDRRAGLDRGSARRHHQLPARFPELCGIDRRGGGRRAGGRGDRQRAAGRDLHRRSRRRRVARRAAARGLRDSRSRLRADRHRVSLQGHQPDRGVSRAVPARRGGTSAASVARAPPRSTWPTSPPGGSTASGSSSSPPGTSRRARSSSGRRAGWSPTSPGATSASSTRRSWRGIRRSTRGSSRCLAPSKDSPRGTKAEHGCACHRAVSGPWDLRRSACLDQELRCLTPAPRAPHWTTGPGHRPARRSPRRRLGGRAWRRRRPRRWWRWSPASPPRARRTRWSTRKRGRRGRGRRVCGRSC